MAIKTITGDATLMMRADVATSMAIFGSFSAFTAMGWFYTGTAGTIRPIFTVGESYVRLAADSYIEVSVSATEVLTLKVYDGSSLNTYTGSTLTANTWYAWAYVKGASANNHKVYLAGDVTTPDFAQDINETVTDNLTTVNGIFLSIPATCRVANFKMWSGAKSLGELDADREKWLIQTSTAARHTAPLRFPADLWNYHDFNGGAAFNDPTYANGYRTHLTNLGDVPLEYAVDPVVLKTVECVTQIAPAQPFALTTTTTAPLWLSQSPVRTNLQYMMDEATNYGLPVGAVIKRHNLFHTTRRVDAGGTAANEFFYRIVGITDGAPADVGVGPDQSSAAVTLTGSYVHYGTDGNALGVSDLTDPITTTNWVDIDPEVARGYLFGYWWGFQIAWSGTLNSPNPKSDPDTYNTTEVYLRVGYTLPADWVFDGFGEGAEGAEIWQIDVGGSGTGSGTDNLDEEDPDSAAEGAHEDNGEPYEAELVTRPFMPGLMIHEFKVSSSALMAKAATGVEIDVSLLRDFETDSGHKSVRVPLDASESELHVMKKLDSLASGELKAVQIRFKDTPNPQGRWNLEMFAMRDEKGTKAN